MYALGVKFPYHKPMNKEIYLEDFIVHIFTFEKKYIINYVHWETKENICSIKIKKTKNPCMINSIIRKLISYRRIEEIYKIKFYENGVTYKYLLDGNTYLKVCKIGKKYGDYSIWNGKKWEYYYYSKRSLIHYNMTKIDDLTIVTHEMPLVRSTYDKSSYRMDTYQKITIVLQQYKISIKKMKYLTIFDKPVYLSDEDRLKNRTLLNFDWKYVPGLRTILDILRYYQDILTVVEIKVVKRKSILIPNLMLELIR